MMALTRTPVENKGHDLLLEEPLEHSSDSPPPLILPGWVKPGPDWGNHSEPLEEDEEEYVCAISEALEKGKICPYHYPGCYCGYAESNYAFVLLKKQSAPKKTIELKKIQRQPAEKQKPQQKTVSVLYRAIKAGREIALSSPRPDIPLSTPRPEIALLSPRREIPLLSPRREIALSSPSRQIGPPGRTIVLPSMTSSLKEGLMDPNFPVNLAEFSNLGLDEISQYCNLTALLDSLSLFFGGKSAPAVTPTPTPRPQTKAITVWMTPPQPQRQPKKRTLDPPKFIIRRTDKVTTTVANVRQTLSKVAGRGPAAGDSLKLKLKEDGEPLAKRVKNKNVP